MREPGRRCAEGKVELRYCRIQASDFAAPACFAGLQERQYEKGKQPAVTLNLVCVIAVSYVKHKLG